MIDSTEASGAILKDSGGLCRLTWHNGAAVCKHYQVDSQSLTDAIVPYRNLRRHIVNWNSTSVFYSDKSGGSIVNIPLDDGYIIYVITALIPGE